jgi:predicted membrane protein
MARCTQYNLVSDLWQVCSFLCKLVSSTIKTDYHNITEIVLKVALSTAILTNSWFILGAASYNEL